MDELQRMGTPEQELDSFELHAQCSHACACDRALALVGVSKLDTAIEYVLRCAECDEYTDAWQRSR